MQDGLQRLVRSWVERPFLASIVLVLVGVGGLIAIPFDVGFPIRDPVPVDALPDVGENQQIVFTEWPGRSPKDVDDQITYPLSSALLGLGGVETVRATSMFGFSVVYVIFAEGISFPRARSAILEKLASLPADTLPAEVTPRLGPEATGVGQIFWYALVPRLPDGTPDGTAFALHELRSIQDFSVKPALQSVPGVAEVASVGGFEREYHVEVDAERMRAHGVTLSAVVAAVRGSNLDVGARTLEVNQVEYVIRGVGFVERPEDLEEVVVGVEKHVPVRLSDVARIVYGPAPRRGALDDAGAPAVGGVVVARHGENPRAVIERVRARVAEISPGLPSRSTPQGLAKVEVDVFYDRAQLIDETLETLSTALWQQVLITIVVILALAGDVAVAVLVAASLPLGLLATFALMRTAGLEANLMSLAGIAIAIGTMVDVAIVLTESMAQRLREGGSNLSERVATGVVAVAPAVVTAALTTLVSFLPVFGLEASEGRLFRPLAWTKTMAVAASLVTGLTVLPVLARFAARWPGVPLGGAMTPARRRASWVLAAAAALALAARWSPFGPGVSSLVNAAGVILALLLGVGGAWLFLAVYPQLLRRSLTRPAGLLATAAAVLALGGLSLFGAPRGWGEGLNRAFPGLGREFMPPFDEGAFLYMPTTMPHASIGQSEELLASLDAAIAAVPEVDRAVGKLGRVASALDPAPISMFEVIVTYRPEFVRDESGAWVRQWRDHVRSTADIWREIEKAASQPGLTGAPVLMPIAARLVMLQSGMRSPFGLELRGPSLEALDVAGRRLEGFLREVPQIRAETVFADRVVGKPYLEIVIDRSAIARCGLTVADVQDVIQTGIGGQVVTRTIEGRARYAVRVRYGRGDRDDLDALRRVLVPTRTGDTVPLEQFAEFRYVEGPQMIRSESTFLATWVLFDKTPEASAVEVVRGAEAVLDAARKEGRLVLPEGVSYRFAGTWESQVRSESRLLLLVPLAVLLVLGLLSLQLGRIRVVAAVGSAVVVTGAGAFGSLWVISAVETVHLSVAVWVGLIALSGIATDDGVLLATELRRQLPGAGSELGARIEVALEAGRRRIRPCLMTTVTTLLALLPVLGSEGRGADVMRPIALPIFGGMGVELLTAFLVPLLLIRGPLALRGPKAASLRSP